MEFGTFSKCRTAQILLCLTTRDPSINTFQCISGVLIRARQPGNRKVSFFAKKTNAIGGPWRREERMMKAKLFATLFLAVLSSVALAQDTATLTGTVRDKSGAVIRDASVSVSNPASNINRDVKSNGEGEYLAGGLPPGTYNLIVTAPGFPQFEAKVVMLSVAQQYRRHVPLIVGSVTTEIFGPGEEITTSQTK